MLLPDCLPIDDVLVLLILLLLFCSCILRFVYQIIKFACFLDFEFIELVFI